MTREDEIRWKFDKTKNSRFACIWVRDEVAVLLQQLDAANQTIAGLLEEKAQLDELTADLAAERDELINEVAQKSAEIERLREACHLAETGFDNMTIQLMDTDEENQRLSKAITMFLDDCAKHQMRIPVGIWDGSYRGLARALQPKDGE